CGNRHREQYTESSDSQKTLFRLSLGNKPMSTDHVLVWDLETIPDFDAVARVHSLDPTDTEALREKLGDKFPKHLFHKIICIGALIAKRSDTGWQVLSKGAPHC